MKSKKKSSRVADRYGMIEALEPRIAPATVTPAAPFTGSLPANPTFVTVTAGGSLLVKAGEVLATGSGGGGSYLLYVEAGEVLVHTTDLNGNNQLDFNEITGLSVGNGARIVSFVDIHGDVVTDLNPDGTLTDHGKGDILLDNNIASIDLRSLNNSDFVATPTQTPSDLVNAHLAMSSYSIYGNIYAGGGLGLANDSTSGLKIDTAGETLQTAKYPLSLGSDFYQTTEPVIGSIYVGSSASGQPFNFGASGAATDVHGNLLAFDPAPGEAGASVYNIGAAASNEPFSIGAIHAGNGGFNAAGGSIVNVALDGDNAGVYKLIAGNAGNGTIGQPGGSIVNFSEAGTFISEVVLQSGNGGTGLTGVGGNAGNITFNPAAAISINAHFVLNYGSGGDGYAGGGTGGGTPSGTFVTAEGKVTQALDVVSTLHSIGSIGATQPFDFNGDGFSDAVFSTTNPDQVVVALGNGTGGVFGLNPNDYIYLNAPAHVDSIVVGNFTGMLNPVTHQPEEDIAVASGSGSFSGIEVFLSKYNPKTGAFEGFSDPLFTPIPSLAPYGYEYTSVAVTKLVAGDFTGNGVLGLAVLAQETVPVSGVKDSVLMYFNGEQDATHPGGTGYFYNTPGNFVDLGDNAHFNPTNSIFEVTALQTFTPVTPNVNNPVYNPGNPHDVIIEADLGAKAFNVIDDSFGLPVFTGTFSFGKVDTNRKLTAGTTNNDSNTDFQVLGIAITQDAANPNLADVVALSQTPVGFLQILQGDGNGNFTLATGDSADQAGVAFDNGITPANPVGIKTVPNQNTGVYSDVAILDYTTNGADVIYVLNVQENAPGNPLTMVATGTEAAGVTATATRSGTQEWFTVVPKTRDAATVAWDVYYPHPILSDTITGSGSTSFGFITADPLSAFPDYQGFTVSQPIINGFFGGGFTLASFKDAGYFIAAGNGGNSQSGPGGAGGSLGQSLTLTTSGGVTTGAGTLSIAFPADPSYEGVARLLAGNGGNGFTHGGDGGSLTGISITYNNASELTGTALLQAGTGGESLTSTGGAGGSLSQLFIITGEYFVAGNGGIGVVGGSGGSLLGNIQAGVLTAEANNYNQDIVLKAGDGATGIAGGGNGGDITSFVNEFPQLVGGTGGLLNYTAGSGGNAVAGQAGTGGSIINSSPFMLNNNLVGNIYLQGGAGGSGLRGGSGGGINGFDQVSTISEIPLTSTMIGGAGGNSTIGTAGTGGSISNVNVAASGVGTLSTFDFSNPKILESVFDAISSQTAISYNRMVAGAGGVSTGGAGGTGGSINSVNTTSTASTAQNVVAAGAGGEGLTAGGAGGNVTSAIVDAGSTSGKVVVIAGDGGDSTSAAPADPKNAAEVALTIGGVNGPGGRGAASSTSRRT